MIDVKWFTDCESDTQFKVPDEGDCPSNRCYADCGPGARPPCLKWHRDPVPLTALRAKAHLTRTQVRTGEYQWQVPGEMQALLERSHRAGQQGRARGRVFGSVSGR